MQEGPPQSERPLPGDLDRWVAADLISFDQARRIAKFEADRAKVERTGRASRAVALLGALTLVSGVGSLVAYNWDRLSDSVKLLGLGILLASSLGAAVFTKRAVDGRAAPKGESASLDVTLLISSGLTLAGLSLVSQIYHQDGEVWQLLFAWSLSVAPLMSFSRSKFAHVFWYLSLFFSLASSFEAVADFFRDTLLRESDHGAWACLLLFFTMSVTLAERFAASEMPGRSWVGRSFVGLLLMALGLFGGLFWFHGDDSNVLFLALGAASFGAIFLAAPSSLGQIGWGSTRQVQTLFGVGLALAVLPMGLPVESGFLAFLAFLMFWGLAWYFAESSGSTKSARLAVFFIGGRVVIASFELFESLLVTGGVLIGLGALALAWSKHSLSRVSGEGAARG